MKKTLLVLSAIATLFAFVSCGGGAEPDGPAKSDTPANNTPKAEAFVLDVKASYDNYIDLIAPVAAASGYTKVNIEAKFDAPDAKQACVQLMSGEDVQASATVQLTASYSVVSGACLAGAKYNAWVNGQPVETDCADTAAKLQFYIQGGDDYHTMAGKIYVKKVWLSADGKEDLVIYEFKAE